LSTESKKRDKYSLKPENIIVDKHGYIRLTDFGLSKILEEDDEKAKTICGTPEYLAPEVIKKLGHRMEVDWWCLGCLIYEMTTGLPPFRNENRMKLFEEIISSLVDVKNVNILITVVIPEFTGFNSKASNKRTKPKTRTWWS
jgi:serine/threonine protein kinase